MCRLPREEKKMHPEVGKIELIIGIICMMVNCQCDSVWHLHDNTNVINETLLLNKKKSKRRRRGNKKKLANWKSAKHKIFGG